MRRLPRHKLGVLLWRCVVESQVWGLADIASVLTGRRFVPKWRVLDFLDFMSGCDVWPGDVKGLRPVVAEELVRQFPQFEGLEVPWWVWRADDADVWLEMLGELRGETFLVCPLPSGAWECVHGLETVQVSERFL